MCRAIEMLAWSDCPSHPDAVQQLRSILDDLGLSDISIETTWIEDDETAERRHFVGSPTFRVDDEELIPTGATDGFALSCRVYRLSDGRFSPTPDPDQLRRAIATRFAN